MLSWDALQRLTADGTVRVQRVELHAMRKLQREREGLASWWRPASEHAPAGAVHAGTFAGLAAGFFAFFAPFAANRAGGALV